MLSAGLTAAFSSITAGPSQVLSGAAESGLYEGRAEALRLRKICLPESTPLLLLCCGVLSYHSELVPLSSDAMAFVIYGDL